MRRRLDLRKSANWPSSPAREQNVVLVILKDWKQRKIKVPLAFLPRGFRTALVRDNQDDTAVQSTLVLPSFE